MNMNKTNNRNLIIICLVCAAAIGISCAMLLTAPKIIESQEYILKDQNGQLALFDSQTQQLCQRYEIYTQLLPQSDIDALRYGIRVQTPQQLNSLLEDYGA